MQIHQYRTFFCGILYAMIAVVIVFLAALSCLYYLSYHPVVHSKPKKIVYEKGEDLQKLFIEKGITKYTIVARFAITVMKLKGYTPKYGEYKLPKVYSLFDILKKLSSHDIIVHNIIIYRGWTVQDIIENINSRNDLCGEITENINDGDILSGKYEFVYPTSKNELLAKMKLITREKVEKLWRMRSKECQVKTRREALILASIIAKEAMVYEDIWLVAGVFTNRIKIGMPLQSDPTVLYVLRNNIDYKHYTFRKFITTDNPYNSYKYKGLPPTPISSPSENDIKAVVCPIPVSYLYFIGDKINRKMHFTNNFSDHLKLQRMFKKKLTVNK